MNSLAPRRRCGVVGGTKTSGPTSSISTVAYRWDEKAGLRRDALSSQVIDALEGAREKETGYEEA
jgi:hypothetical protein